MQFSTASLFLSLLYRIQCTGLYNDPTSSISKRSCGDGKIDPGEECDFGIQNQTECCDATCKKRPNLRYTCNSNQGVCLDGTCVSRATQCHNFDQNILSNGQDMYGGPFAPCNPGIPSGSIDYQCTLACSGSSISNKQNFCLDLKLYGNVDNVVADGSYCGDLGQGKQMGLCVTGVCNMEICGKYRCTNHGRCLRGLGGVFQCQCEPGYLGDFCNQQPNCAGKVDECSVCNGDGSSCPWDANTAPLMNFFTTPVFKSVIFPVAITLGCLLFFVILYFIYRAARPVIKKMFEQTSKEGTFHSFSVMTPSSTFTTSLSNTNSSPSKVTVTRGASVKSKKKLFNSSRVSTNSVGLSVKFDEFRCIHDYEPQIADELELKMGDILFKLFEFDDGWCKGYNTRTQAEGVYPVSFTEKVEKKTDNLEPQ